MGWDLSQVYSAPTAQGSARSTAPSRVRPGTSATPERPNPARVVWDTSPTAGRRADIASPRRPPNVEGSDEPLPDAGFCACRRPAPGSGPRGPAPLPGVPPAGGAPRGGAPGLDPPRPG